MNYISKGLSLNDSGFSLEKSLYVRLSPQPEVHGTFLFLSPWTKCFESGRTLSSAHRAACIPQQPSLWCKLDTKISSIHSRSTSAPFCSLSVTYPRSINKSSHLIRELPSRVPAICWFSVYRPYKSILAVCARKSSSKKPHCQLCSGSEASVTVRWGSCVRCKPMAIALLDVTILQ